MKKMQFCYFCGEELGIYDKPHRGRDTCGKSECNREARNDEAQERFDAHEELDRMNGWD